MDNKIEEVTNKIEEVTDEVTEKESVQIPETREQIRARLKDKLRSKKQNRSQGLTRNKRDDINNSVKKLGNVLAENNIQNPEQITPGIIEKVMSTISKKDIELIMNNMQQNSAFKELLESINNKYTE